MVNPDWPVRDWKRPSRSACKARAGAGSSGRLVDVVGSNGGLNQHVLVVCK